MDLMLAHVRVDLHPRDHIDAVPPPSREGLVHALGGVMIGEREGGDGMLARGPDKPIRG
jgi:hypothetical protein